MLKAVHPSPLSAYRGFFGCKHFSLANTLLEKESKDPIDWTELTHIEREPHRPDASSPRLDGTP